MGWYRQDAFLNDMGNANFDPKQSNPGAIGGIKPSPATMADFVKPGVRETFSTDEAMEQRNESAKADDSVSPVATDSDMSKPTVYAPGRDEDGEVEGEVSLYSPMDYAANLFGPTVLEEDMEK